jgi:hypothetical protein
MKELTETQKKYIIDELDKACGGTPIQSHREFASHYLGSVVINMVSYWDEIVVALEK